MGKYRNWSPAGRDDALMWTHDIEPLKLRVISKNQKDVGGSKAMVTLSDTDEFGDGTMWAKHFDTKTEAEQWARNWLRNHPYPDDYKVYADTQYFYRATILETDKSDVNDEWMARIELREDLPADGVEAGEETWIDLIDIDKAMETSPADRNQARRFAKEENWIGGGR